MKVLEYIYFTGHNNNTTQKMNFSIKDFFSASTEEIFNGKLHFLYSVIIQQVTRYKTQRHI